MWVASMCEDTYNHVLIVLQTFIICFTENIRTNDSSESCRLLVAASCLCRLSIHKRHRCCRCSCSYLVSQSHVTTDRHSARLSWNKAPIWELRPDFYYCQTVAGLLMWGALSDERTGLSLLLLLSSPAQSFSGPSPAGLVTIFYCLRFETPPTWRTRSLYLYPPGTGWAGYTPRYGVTHSLLRFFWESRYTATARTT
jgi:hypothetical protein